MKFNGNEFLTNLLGLKWTHIYNIKNPILIDSAITENITSVLDIHAPVKSFRIGNYKNKTSKNISKECINQILNRNRLRRQARRSNLDIDHLENHYLSISNSPLSLSQS